LASNLTLDYLKVVYSDSDDEILEEERNISEWDKHFMKLRVIVKPTSQHYKEMNNLADEFCKTAGLIYIMIADKSLYTQVPLSALIALCMIISII